MKEDSVSLIQRLSSSGVGKKAVPDPGKKENTKGPGSTPSLSLLQGRRGSKN